MEGFHYSVLLGNLLQSWEPKPCSLIRGIVNEILTKLNVVGFRILIGTPAQSVKEVYGQLRDTVIRIFESSPAGITADVTIPTHADLLTFDFRFSLLGDGDWITVSFNDTLLFSFLGNSFIGNDFQHIEIPALITVRATWAPSDLSLGSPWWTERRWR